LKNYLVSPLRGTKPPNRAPLVVQDDLNKELALSMRRK
jgi:hypothetical protein